MFGGTNGQDEDKAERESSARGRRRKVGSTTGGSRSTSVRSNGVNASRASRAVKNSGAGRSRRKSGGPITSANRRVRAVASQVKGVVVSGGKGLGAVASRSRGVVAVGAPGLAALAGVAGGIGLERWNNSYSRTQAFARRRRGRR
jgi:hypothetical protein